MGLALTYGRKIVSKELDKSDYLQEMIFTPNKNEQTHHHKKSFKHSR